MEVLGVFRLSSFLLTAALCLVVADSIFHIGFPDRLISLVFVSLMFSVTFVILYLQHSTLMGAPKDVHIFDSLKCSQEALGLAGVLLVTTSSNRCTDGQISQVSRLDWFNRFVIPGSFFSDQMYIAYIKTNGPRFEFSSSHSTPEPKIPNLRSKVK